MGAEIYNPDTVNDVEIDDIGSTINADTAKAITTYGLDERMASEDLINLVMAGTLEIRRVEDGQVYTPLAGVDIIRGIDATRNEEGVLYSYPTQRPLNTTTIFLGAGDDTGVGDGTDLWFDLADTDDDKTVDLTFNEDIYLKDGMIMSPNCPFGSYLEIEIHHPQAGLVGSFGRKVWMMSGIPVPLDTNDKGKLDAGLILRIKVHNSDGTNGRDAAAAFQVAGRIEVFRSSTI